MKYAIRILEDEKNRIETALAGYSESSKLKYQDSYRRANNNLAELILAIDKLSPRPGQQ